MLVSPTLCVGVNFSLFGAGLLNGESDKMFVYFSGLSIRFSENEFVPLKSGKSYVSASFTILMDSVFGSQ